MKITSSRSLEIIRVIARRKAAASSTLIKLADVQSRGLRKRDNNALVNATSRPCVCLQNAVEQRTNRLRPVICYVIGLCLCFRIRAESSDEKTRVYQDDACYLSSMQRNLEIRFAKIPTRLVEFTREMSRLSDMFSTGKFELRDTRTHTHANVYIKLHSDGKTYVG